MNFHSNLENFQTFGAYLMLASMHGDPQIHCTPSPEKSATYTNVGPLVGRGPYN